MSVRMRWGSKVCGHVPFYEHETTARTVVLYYGLRLARLGTWRADCIYSYIQSVDDAFVSVNILFKDEKDRIPSAATGNRTGPQINL